MPRPSRRTKRSSTRGRTSTHWAWCSTKCSRARECARIPQRQKPDTWLRWRIPLCLRRRLRRKTPTSLGKSAMSSTRCSPRSPTTATPRPLSSSPSSTRFLRRSPTRFPRPARGSARARRSPRFSRSLRSPPLSTSSGPAVRRRNPQASSRLPVAPTPKLRIRQRPRSPKPPRLRNRRTQNPNPQRCCLSRRSRPRRLRPRPRPRRRNPTSAQLRPPLLPNRKSRSPRSPGSRSSRSRPRTPPSTFSRRTNPPGRISSSLPTSSGSAGRPCGPAPPTRSRKPSPA